MQENTGGAGGFHFGIKKAFNEDFDWVWVMDDDIEANEICLEEMLKLNSISKCIHPRKVWSDGTDYIWGSVYNLQRLKSKNMTIKINMNPLAARMDTVSFEGMLIHKDIIKEIGFPDEDFFIAGDDIEYGLRVAKETQIVSAYEAIFVRKILPSMKSSLSRNSMRIGAWREYYYLRNLFLIKKHHNLGLIQHYWIFLRLVRKIIGIFIYNDDDKILKIKHFLLAYKHGLSNKFGHIL